jgi:hypothetical protein
MRYLRKNSSGVCRVVAEKKVPLRLTRSNISKVISWGSFDPSKQRSENAVDMAYKVLSLGSGSKVLKSSAADTDYKVIGRDRIILEGKDASSDTDPDSFVVHKTHYFEPIVSSERKPPKYLTWTEEELKNGGKKYFAKWGRWLATIFILKGKTTWVIEDVDGNTVANGELGEGQIDSAKSIAEKRFIEVYK